MRAHNKELKIFATAIVIWHMAVLHLFNRVLGTDLYKWSDLIACGYFVIIAGYVNWMYWRGWKCVLSMFVVNLLNWFVIVAIVDALHCYSVYSRFDSYMAGNAYLNNTVSICDWSYYTGYFIAVNVGLCLLWNWWSRKYMG